MKLLITLITLILFLTSPFASAQSVDDLLELNATPLSVSERRVVVRIEVTNRSDHILSGVAAIVSLENSRPLPISETALESLLRIPGGLQPGETVSLTEQINTRNDLVAARLREDSNIRVGVRVLAALDIAGQSLVCKAIEGSPDWRLFSAQYDLSWSRPSEQRCLQS